MALTPGEIVLELQKKNLDPWFSWRLAFRCGYDRALEDAVKTLEENDRERNSDIAPIIRNLKFRTDN